MVSVSLAYNIKQGDRHLMDGQNLQKKFHKVNQESYKLYSTVIQ